MSTTREGRQRELDYWHSVYRVPMRNDSRLTELFLSGQLAMSSGEVVRELMCTDFLYKATLYEVVIEDYMRKVASRLRDEYSLSWKATWSIVQFYGPMALKLMCISATTLTMPEVMPSELVECAQ